MRRLVASLILLASMLAGAPAAIASTPTLAPTTAPATTASTGAQANTTLPGGWQLCVGGSCPHTRVTAVSVGMRTTCIVTSGTVWCWDGGTAWTVPLPRPVTGIAVGDVHACAIAGKDRRVWCWGQNVRGELGTGTRVSSRTPLATPATGARDVSVGSGTSCAITTRNHLSCWGWGFAPGWTDQLTPRRITETPPVTGFLATNSPSMCATAADGLWCTASVDSEQDNTATQARFTHRPGTTATDTGALARYHGCTLTDGQVACWTNEDTPTITGETASSVAVTDTLVCLVTGGTVTCRTPDASYPMHTRSSHRYTRVHAGWQVAALALDGDLWLWQPGTTDPVQVTFLPPRHR